MRLTETSTETKQGRVDVGEIYDTIRQSIISGEFEEGQFLRQDEIAAKLNVSKTPIRECLRRLEAEGLVEFLSKRGFRVATISAEDVLEMLDIRIGLECRALELAMPEMVSSDFTKAEDILDRYSKEERIDSWSKYNQAFHMALYEPCGRPKLLRMIADLHRDAGRSAHFKISRVSGLDRPMIEHQRILDLCKSGDVRKAVQCLKDHMETSRKEFAASVREKKLSSL